MNLTWLRLDWEPDEVRFTQIDHYHKIGHVLNPGNRGGPFDLEAIAVLKDGSACILRWQLSYHDLLNGDIEQTMSANRIVVRPIGQMY